MDSSILTEESETGVAETLPKRKVWRAGTLVYTSAGLATVFAFLFLTDFAGSLKDRSISFVFQIMLRKYGASDMLMGGLMASLPAVLGLLLSPVISYKSDRHRGRWGRRIPYVLVTAPLISISMIGLGISPWLGEGFNALLGSRSPGLSACVLGSFALCWTMFNFANTACGAVFGGLLSDVLPQAVVGRFLGAWRAVSLLVGIGFGHWGMAKATDHYQFIFIGFGLLCGAAMLVTCLGVREGQYPPPPAAPARGRGASLSAVKAYFNDCFGGNYYIWFFVAPALASMATLGVNLFSVYYATSAGMSMALFGNCIAVTYAISLFMAYPLGWLADRYHPLRVLIVTVVAYAVTSFLGGIFIRDSFTFSVALVAHGVVSGSMITAMASLGLRLLPRERFAEISSAGGIVGALLTMAFSPLLGLFLDHVHHDYRYTFIVGGWISLIALVALMVLHSKFMQLGGPHAYVAPE